MADPQFEQQLTQARLLGWAPQCDLVNPGMNLGRDLVLQRGPNGLDLARVSGMDALTQSLSIALTTRLGDDLFNTAFGFDGLNALAEEPDPLLARERIRIAVIQVLRKEPRVRRIIDVKLSGQQLDLISPPPSGPEEEVPPDPRQLYVSTAFEVISGEPINLNLGAVGPNV